MKTNNKSLTYNESCFIVNALDNYINLFKNSKISAESIKDMELIKTKYEKLENQILLLTIKD